MPTSPSYEDVLAAAARLNGVAHRTPVLRSRTLDQAVGAQLFLKAENFQRIGAFKFRGAYNMLSQLAEEQRRNGVVSYSSGNHAQAVALAGALLGIRTTILMPDDAPQSKVAATQGYGAEIVRYNRLTDDRAVLTDRYAAEHGLTIVPPYDHPWIIAGQGTAALELLEDVPDLDVLLAPIGGGGLISGSCIAGRGTSETVQIFGVEPEQADDARQSLAAGHRVSIPPPDTIADGLRSTSPGELTFPIMQRSLAGILTVLEAEIVQALTFALFRMKVLIEPSGAVALAAAMARKVPVGGRIGVILSGGNIDPSALADLLRVG